ncbi:MAG TPA: hypothetical protein VFU31_27825 [Candidatus Binatia bacterium]|nr:hypothetical protein [Candidatus Binatia bacterium]
MTGIFATATVATASIGLEIVLYEPISRIGGISRFVANPQRYPT